MKLILLILRLQQLNTKPIPMKKLLLAAVVTLLFSCSGSDDSNVNPNPNPVEICDNVYTGDVELKTQAEVDAFGAKAYCRITGFMKIGNVENSDIVNLSALQTLEEIGSDLWIISNNKLTSLHGLENLSIIKGALVISFNENIKNLDEFVLLTELGSNSGSSRFVLGSNSAITNINGLRNITVLEEINVSGNSNLTDLSGLERITQATHIAIIANPKLKSLKGLENITNTNYLDIQNNAALESLEQLMSLKKITIRSLILYNNALTNLHGLENLETAGNFTVGDNEALLSLDGLDKLHTVSQLIIHDNPRLTSLSHLSALTSVVSNTVDGVVKTPLLQFIELPITSLDGLQNITAFEGGRINVYECLELTDYCAVKALIPESVIDFEENAYNPTKDDIISGNCAQ